VGPFSCPATGSKKEALAEPVWKSIRSPTLWMAQMKMPKPRPSSRPISASLPAISTQVPMEAEGMSPATGDMKIASISSKPLRTMPVIMPPDRKGTTAKIANSRGSVSTTAEKNFSILASSIVSMD
jgi:hypothetical protein